MTELKLAFTCIGDNVNIASRVENLNKHYGTTILVTKATHDHIDRELFSSRKIATVKVAGKQKETELYEIHADRSPERLDLDETYERSLEYFETNRPELSRKTLGILLERYPHDAPALHLWSRIDSAKNANWEKAEILAK